MTAAGALTRRQLQVLWATRRLEDFHGQVATGTGLQELFSLSTLDADAARASVQGLHRTASSLVRRRLLTAGTTGTHTRSYRITAAGRQTVQLWARLHGRPL